MRVRRLFFGKNFRLVKKTLAFGEKMDTGPKQCEQAGTDRTSPYLMQFEEADANQTVYYLLRWISKKGEPGAWSPMFSATITN